MFDGCIISANSLEPFDCLPVIGFRTYCLLKNILIKKDKKKTPHNPLYHSCVNLNYARFFSLNLKSYFLKFWLSLKQLLVYCSTVLEQHLKITLIKYCIARLQNQNSSRGSGLQRLTVRLRQSERTFGMWTEYGNLYIFDTVRFNI